MRLEEIKSLVVSRGYVFDGVVPFRTKDRICWHRAGLRVSLCLGKKIRDITLEEFGLFVWAADDEVAL